MIRECYKTQSGILFEPDKLRNVGLDFSSLWPEVKPRPPPFLVEDGMKILTIESARKKNNGAKIRSEEWEELKDALSPAYDQLALRRAWWLLEILPVQQGEEGSGHPDSSKLWHRYRFVVDHIFPILFDCRANLIACRLNRGAPRDISNKWDTVRVHRSVKIRTTAEYEKEDEKYNPKPMWPDKIKWVG
jgi:hypothetical protein